jgi:hypothetical protein
MGGVSTASASKKKSRGHRVRLTHIEIRRGTALRIRLSIADDVLGEAGDELGALIRRISPGTVTSTLPAPLSSPNPVPSPNPAPSPNSAQLPHPARGAIVVTSPAPPSDFVVSPTHDGNDDAYHAGLRDRLAELFGSLCDASLEDALEIARSERARRVEGIN